MFNEKWVVLRLKTTNSFKVMAKLFDLESNLRANIMNLAPYSSARDEYTGKEGVFLDANENPYGSVGEEGYNRYPDPFQVELKNGDR